MKEKPELAASSMAPLLLMVLCEGESYGHAILRRLKEMSESELGWADGMVYPLLRRLLRLGYLTSEWRALPAGRRRRFYAITDDGRAVVAGSRAASRAFTDMWPGPGGLLAVLRCRPSEQASPGARPGWPARPPVCVA